MNKRIWFFKIYLILVSIISLPIPVARGDDFIDSALKFGAIGAALFPFKFSADKLALGGLINISSQSTAELSKNGRVGFGAFAAYELTRIEAEAYVKRLHFDSNVHYANLNVDHFSKNSTLTYSFGLRIPIFTFINVKIGYSLHEIESETTVQNSRIEQESGDNGYYYGGGLRMGINETFSIYADVLGYYFVKNKIHLSEAEAGFRYAF